MKFSIILKKIKVNRKTTGLIEQDQLPMLRETWLAGSLDGKALEPNGGFSRTQCLITGNSNIPFFVG